MLWHSGQLWLSLKHSLDVGKRVEARPFRCLLDHFMAACLAYAIWINLRIAPAVA